jgi:hypothetical protein
MTDETNYPPDGKVPLGKKVKKKRKAWWRRKKRKKDGEDPKSRTSRGRG